MMTRYLYPLLFPVFFLISACNENDERMPAEEGRIPDYSATVHFIAEKADTVSSIQAAVADTDASRATGLMDVFEMPMDRGMLFIFPDEKPRSFWMANTPLALDIIFVSEEMEIVRIHRNTLPYSERNVSSGATAMYAVETNAGYTRRNDIKEGMSIAYEL
ncbi:MAG: DUF192 domain-containing protein [Balneolaceae bacterium]